MVREAAAHLPRGAVETELEPILGPVRLIDHHDDVRPVGQLGKVLALLGPELLHGREHDPADLAIEERLQVGDALGLRPAPRPGDPGSGRRWRRAGGRGRSGP